MRHPFEQKSGTSWHINSLLFSSNLSHLEPLCFAYLWEKYASLITFHAWPQSYNWFLLAVIVKKRKTSIYNCIFCFIYMVVKMPLLLEGIFLILPFYLRLSLVVRHLANVHFLSISCSCFFFFSLMIQVHHSHYYVKWLWILTLDLLCQASHLTFKQP